MQNLWALEQNCSIAGGGTNLCIWTILPFSSNGSKVVATLAFCTFFCELTALAVLPVPAIGMNILNRTEFYFEICHLEKVDKYYFVSKQLVGNVKTFFFPPHKLISSATNTPVGTLLIDTPAVTVQSTHLQSVALIYHHRWITFIQ